MGKLRDYWKGEKDKAEKLAEKIDKNTKQVLKKAKKKDKEARPLVEPPALQKPIIKSMFAKSLDLGKNLDKIEGGEKDPKKLSQASMKALSAISTYAKEVKYRVGETSGGVSGGTIASMMNMMEEARIDPTITDILSDPYSLNPPNMPRGEDGQDQNGALYDLDFMQWTGPFVMAAINTRVVRRSNALRQYIYGHDFRYSEAMLMGNGPGGYVKASMLAGMSMLMMLGTAFTPTRNLLQKVVPKPGEGPSRQAIEKGFFKIELFGKDKSDPVNKLRVAVNGEGDPGYGATSKMLAECAVCLAKDELPDGGGILTPSVAMGEQLLLRLQENAGMTFTEIADS